jgi:hypothetical protein
MSDVVTRLINRPLTADGPITRLFRAAGAHDFPDAALHVLGLPYGRITDRSRFWLVLEEGRGTCTTKHATLVELAREQGIEVELMLGIYEMSEGNTPGVGRVLSVHGLSGIKNDLHRRFLRDWIDRTEPVRGRSLDDVWRIREACIAALGGGAYATPAR